MRKPKFVCVVGSGLLSLMSLAALLLLTGFALILAVAREWIPEPSPRYHPFWGPVLNVVFVIALLGLGWILSQRFFKKCYRPPRDANPSEPPPTGTPGHGQARIPETALEPKTGT